MAGVECSGEDVVVFRPPAKVTTTDPVLEDEADDTPGDVVDGCGGRNETCTGEDDGEVDVFDHGVGVAFGEEPRDDRSDGTDEEEEG